MNDSFSTPPSPGESPMLLLDVRRVAALLGCSPRHVYRLADAGRMPRPLRIGTLVRWQATTLKQWLDNNCQPVRPALKRSGK